MRSDPRHLTIPLAALLFAAAIVFIAGMGEGTSPGDGTLSVATHLVSSGMALAYVLAAVGLGRLCTRLYLGARDPLALQAAMGIGLMLSLSHLLGWSGAFRGGGGRVIALLPIIAGIALLAHQAAAAAQRAASVVPAGGARGSDQRPRSFAGRVLRFGADPLVLIVAPGLALLLVGACQPPGWLWSSEFGGYDALSYHLQLPQEWFEARRITPLAHNVYSFLPGYVEAAFLHVGVAMGAPPFPDPGVIGAGLLAHDGAGAVAAQVLHALMTILAGAVTGSLAQGMVRPRAGGDSEPQRAGDGSRGRLAFAVAFGLVVLTPWSIVVGSLAYNEMAVLACFAGALIAAFDDRLSAARRGAVAAFLVGAACGAKPTAITFAGVPVAIALAGSLPARDWWRAAVPGVLVGLVMVAPWLVRNWLACGNPVFPFATALFGTGHWSLEQVSRYAGAHRFDGTLAERLGLLFFEEPVTPGEVALGPTRHRGVMHPQFFAFFPLVLGAALACVRRGGASHADAAPLRPAVLLVLGLAAQACVWLFTTHLQSRFLLPLVVPGAALIAARLGAGLPARVPIGAARAIGGLALALQLGASLVIFSREQRGAPNGSLAVGPGYFSGSLFATSMGKADVEERALALNSAPIPACINLLLANTPTFQFSGTVPGSVYLLGDATPFYYSVPVLYHTTYDSSPLGDAIRRNPTDPNAWTRELRARGVAYVLYAPTEIARLRASGWYDPLVTNEMIERWLADAGMLVHEWPADLRVLCQLRDVPPVVTPVPPATPKSGLSAPPADQR